MADKKNDELNAIKLSKLATAGAWTVLRRTKIKGRGDARAHARITALLKDKCMKLQKGSEDSYDFVGGTILLDDERYDYLDRITTALLDGGTVEGDLGQPLGELVEALDAVPEPK
jgi:hypothetical protein